MATMPNSTRDSLPADFSDALKPYDMTTKMMSDSYTAAAIQRPNVYMLKKYRSGPRRYRSGYSRLKGAGWSLSMTPTTTMDAILYSWTPISHYILDPDAPER
jgi:hypothetical protein